MKAQILVYTPRLHPRLRYVFRWLGERWGNSTILLTDQWSACQYWQGIKMHYTTGPLRDSGLWLPQASSQPLFQNTAGDPEVHQMPGRTVLYPIPGGADPGFDLPAALFWMLSRAEEYPHESLDNHGRFPAAASLAARRGFLDQPVCDQWAEQLRQTLSQAFPHRLPPPPAARVQWTIDVDYAWLYAHRPWAARLRTWMGESWRDGLKGFQVGLRHWSGGQADPFDVYPHLRRLDAILFFPLGDPGPFDRQHDWRSPAYQELIREWHARGLAGLHPSYPTLDGVAQLQREVARYREITGEPPRRSRQHFLRMRVPETYRLLLDAGISEDWTMGYADLPGFRAGTAWPFSWYDRDAERETPLRVVPFTVMDVTLQRYLGLTPGQGREQCRALQATIQATGGWYIPLWHNHALTGHGRDWAGWEALSPWVNDGDH